MSRGPAGTQWADVVAVVVVGLLSAFQLGKVGIALPAIRADLGLSLAAGSWLLAVPGVVGTVLVIALGALASRHGVFEVALAGLVLAVLGIAIGISASGPATLFAGRFVEAVGYLCTMVTGPALMVRVTAPQDRWLAFGILGSIVPLGMAVIMVAAPPLLSAWGWRGLWAVIGGLHLLGALLFSARLGPGRSWRSAAGRARAGAEAITGRGVWRLPGLRPLAVLFLIYSLNWIVFVGFLPTLYLDRGLSLGLDGLLTGAATLANVAGNMLGGLLARRGVPRRIVLAGTTAAMGACAIGIFAPGLPLWAAYGLAVAFSTVGGLLPSTVLLTIPELVAERRDVPAASAVVMQGAQFGTAVGPPLFAAAVAASGGWGACGWGLALLGAAGTAVALTFRARPRIGAAA